MLDRGAIGVDRVYIEILLLRHYYYYYQYCYFDHTILKKFLVSSFHHPMFRKMRMRIGMMIIVMIELLYQILVLQNGKGGY